MTKVSFYKINDGDRQRKLLVCKIAAKAYQKEGLTVFINTESPEQSKELDELLWSYSPASFLPHSADSDSREAIVISCDNDPGQHHGLLINLCTTVPAWVSRFERATEIVYNDQQVIIDKRKSFEFYKKRGYPLQYHDLTNGTPD